MKILNYFYNDELGTLSIEFSTKTDKNDFYRSIELETDDILYYSPEILEYYEIEDNLNKQFVMELVNQYLTENDLPKQQSL